MGGRLAGRGHGRRQARRAGDGQPEDRIRRLDQRRRRALVECRTTPTRPRPDGDTRERLYRAGHDLRGQALTFEFPLVARVATSLCKMLDGHEGAAAVALIDAHVECHPRHRQAEHQGCKPTRSRNTLATELEARVSDYLDKACKIRTRVTAASSQACRGLLVARIVADAQDLPFRPSSRPMASTVSGGAAHAVAMASATLRRLASFIRLSLVGKITFQLLRSAIASSARSRSKSTDSRPSCRPR